jgi:hypothetical protein
MDDGCSISQDVLVAGDFNIPDFNFQVNKKNVQQILLRSVFQHRTN